MRGSVLRSPRLSNALALFIAVFVLRAPAFVYAPVDIDETDWVTIAQMVRRGAVLYADIAEKKPPLSYWFYIPFAPFGFRLWPVQLAAIGWVFATCLAAGRAARAWTDSEDAGWVAAWICAAAMACNVFSVNAELMLNLPAALALLAYVRAERSRSLAFDLLAGAAIGVASAFKHQAGILLAALGAAIAISALRSRELRAAAARVAVLAAGFALPWAAIVAAYAASGHLDAFVEWNVARNLLYVTAGGGAGSALLRAGEGVLLFVVLAAPVPWILALKETLAAPKKREGPAHVGLLLALWFTWIPVALGGRFYAHYFLQLAPPLAIVAAPGALVLLQGPRRRMALFGALAPLVLFQAIGLGRFIAGDFPGQDLRAREVAEWLAAESRPEERVFIWGHFTPIYYFAERLPGTRYTNTSVHMGDFDPGHLTPGFDLAPFRSARDVALAIEDLEKNAPAFVVDTAPADIHRWSKVPLAAFPELEACVRARYTLAATPGGAAVHRLRRAGE